MTIPTDTLTGVIAYLDRPTIDGRRILTLGLRPLPLAVAAWVDDLGRLRDPGEGNDLPVVVGHVVNVSIVGDEVRAVVELDGPELLEGRDRCGACLEVLDVEWKPGAHGPTMLRGTIARIVLTIEPGAWPDAVLHRVPDDG